MAEVVASQKTDDPYDLGDTELYPRLEVEPYTKPQSAAVPAAPESPSAPAPPASQPVYDEATKRWKDPVTQLFTKAPESVKPAHPDWIVQQAKELAFDDEDLAQPTEHVYKQINRVMRERLASQRQADTFRTIDEPRTKLPDFPGAPDNLPKPDESLGIEEEEIHPGILKVLKGLRDEVKSLKEELGGVKNYQAQRQFESYAQSMHRVISEHGNPDIVGDGSLDQWDEKRWATSHEGACRTAISDMARRLAGPKAGPAQIIGKVPEAIFRLRYGKTKPAEQPAPKPPSKQPKFTPEEWDEAGLAAPTHRNGAAEPPSEEKARINLETRMRERGLNGQPEDKDILDTLL